MGERRREANEIRLLVDRGRLNGRDLMAAEGLSYDVEAARQCRIAKGLIMIARMGRPDGRDERLFWIGEFTLRFGKCSGDRRDRFARTLHDSPPSQGDRN